MARRAGPGPATCSTCGTGDRSAGFRKCLCADRSRHPEEHGRRRELERGVSRGDGERPVPWLVGWLVVAPGEGGPSTVYAGGNARGAFKSLDGGSTWTLAKSGLFATSIYSLAIDPQNPHTVYAGVYVAGLYR